VLHVCNHSIDSFNGLFQKILQVLIVELIELVVVDLF